ncbi:hypothetical protein QBC34DRAFT_350186 [Podospora aff. communis PSN243]|uniref:Uncharacterized protein n=1 Tax=Podospora aff. communis PSN243 TaxID=3040156 RepID=A0AAV9GNT6_9PEZI|nr:hypothetical protein QBC34DRAFT_350186 [Podospora aff. communis PSN243]
MNLKSLLLATLVTSSTSVSAQLLNATGAPFPGINNTGLSTEGLVTVVTVVGRFLTYCAEPTVLKWGKNVYSVTAPTTLTIDDCPCTITTTRCLGPDCYYKGPGPHAMTPKGDTPVAPTGGLGVDGVDLNTRIAAGSVAASASAKGVVVSGARRSVGSQSMVLGVVGMVVGALVGV